MICEKKSKTLFQSSSMIVAYETRGGPPPPPPPPPPPIEPPMSTKGFLGVGITMDIVSECVVA